MWGLLERTVAAQALMAVAAELKLARADMQSLLPVEEHAALELFFNRTVEAAGEGCEQHERCPSSLHNCVWCMTQPIQH